ncbi:hypothetical protein CCR85_04230 [Rhodothalassium salexigens]|uniref:hypothetical protein n=1 Tax=Rhodothalassium salexigens TaxID=1086 RepID=UPI001911A8C5|nr:hypothetical protein [Rhodothalassium salexigens]MBK5910699.1 hypothetical protein [Rhodothalassium salexigens]MBK5921671.1 hypothetical protein [Rhodothalassium salexigens]
MSAPALRFLAGPSAYAAIRQHGFDPQAITAMVGASGGPKFLGLYHLDRAILRHFQRWYAGRTRPLHLLGSSIGAWRFANYARRDPVAAFDRLWALYGDYEWTRAHDSARVTADTEALIERVLGPTGGTEILAHPYMRLHVVAARGRGLASLSDKRALGRLGFGAGLAATAGLNLVDRRTLGLFFERTILSDPRGRVPGNWRGLPTRRASLRVDNLFDALMATVAIPFLIDAREIPYAPRGRYRDGGIVDYHFAVPDLAAAGEMVFYPHFSAEVTPGWFDKALKRRRADARVLDRTLIVCPSDAFLASLPMGKIPDRHDFERHDNATRKDLWRRTVAATERLAEEFDRTIETDALAERLELIG